MIVFSFKQAKRVMKNHAYKQLWRLLRQQKLQRACWTRMTLLLLVHMVDHRKEKRCQEMSALKQEQVFAKPLRSLTPIAFMSSDHLVWAKSPNPRKSTPLSPKNGPRTEASSKHLKTWSLSSSALSRSKMLWRKNCKSLEAPTLTVTFWTISQVTQWNKHLIQSLKLEKTALQRLRALWCQKNDIPRCQTENTSYKKNQMAWFSQTATRICKENS